MITFHLFLVIRMNRSDFIARNYISQEALGRLWEQVYGKWMVINFVKLNGQRREISGYLRGHKSKWYISEEGKLKRIGLKRILSIKYIDSSDEEHDRWVDHEDWIWYKKNALKTGNSL